MIDQDAYAKLVRALAASADGTEVWISSKFVSVNGGCRRAKHDGSGESILSALITVLADWVLREEAPEPPR